MKRKILILPLSCMLMLGLTACAHEHTWQEATCTTPKICTECDEIEGDVLEHTWVEATCVEAKTCGACGETEGDPLQADFEKYGIPCNVVLDQEFESDKVYRKF